MICFFDTNVLVYGYDATDAGKRERALDCLERAVRDDTVVLSTQVLHEFFHTVTRKLRPPLSAREAAQQLRHLAQFQIVGATAQSALAATALATDHRIAWWDALILEAALRAGAQRLYSEDGSHGRRFGSLEVVNPFLV
ncbi:PIN domain-containing protein [Pseudorhodoferax sp.]|uniref:PIN domain-containing protein n=1 Tax=Pseudorhodoferax sp. TaxID=1993553 RepID=UPI0039E3F0D4